MRRRAWNLWMVVPMLALVAGCESHPDGLSGPDDPPGHDEPLAASSSELLGA